MPWFRTIARKNRQEDSTNFEKPRYVKVTAYFRKSLALLHYRISLRSRFVSSFSVYRSRKATIGIREESYLPIPNIKMFVDAFGC